MSSISYHSGYFQGLKSPYFAFFCFRCVVLGVGESILYCIGLLIFGLNELGGMIGCLNSFKGLDGL